MPPEMQFLKHTKKPLKLKSFNTYMSLKAINKGCQFYFPRKKLSQNILYIL